jgi:hypothetical protein
MEIKNDDMNNNENEEIIKTLYQKDIDIEVVLSNYYNKIKPDENKVKDFLRYLFSDMVNKKNYSIFLNKFFFNLFKDYGFKIFENIDIKIKSKNIPLIKVILYIFRPLIVENIIVKNIEDYYNYSKEKTWSLLIELNKKDFLTNEILDFIKIKYELNNQQTEELLLSIRSFQTLTKFKNGGFDIWVIINKSKINQVKTLLPFYVSEYESMRKDFSYFNKLSIENRAEFFINEKDIWQNKNEVKENIKEYKTRCALTCRYIRSETIFRKVLKSLDIKDKDIIHNLNDCSPFGTDYSITKDNFLKSGKWRTLIKITPKNEDIIEDNIISPLIQLFKSEPLSIESGNLKTNNNIFLQLLQSLIKKVDFSEIREEKNLINQLLDNNIKFYMPIKDFNISAEKEIRFCSFYSKEESRSVSLVAILNFFKQNNVNFQHEYKNKMVLNDIIKTLLNINFKNSIGKEFEPNGLIWEEFKILSKTKKEMVWSEFVNNWNSIWSKELIEKHKAYYIYSKYKGESNIILALNMFMKLLFEPGDVKKETTDLLKTIKETIICVEDYIEIKIIIKKIDSFVLHNKLNEELLEKNHLSMIKKI